MGFLLTHSTLEKAKGAAFLQKFKFLEKQEGGEEEGVLTRQTVFKIFCKGDPPKEPSLRLPPLCCEKWSAYSGFEFM